MGGGKDRHSRPTHPIDVRELAKLADAAAAAPAPDAELSFEDLEDPDALAPGTERELVSRATTLHDPLTTSLLAEVARRSQTLELDPEQVDEAKAAEPEA